MTLRVNRRDMLRALIAGTALTGHGVRAAQTGSVGIIGGGMAGVSLAWFLDGSRNVVLLESGDSVGGNIHSAPVELDGLQFEVDMGAQYFHPGPYPLYTALLTYLGLHSSDPGTPGESHAFPASITLFEGSEPTPRFVSPVLPGRAWPLIAGWNQEGVAAFGTAFYAASVRESLNGDWALTLEEWLPTLGLSTQQWEGMVLPWAASLFSGNIDQARGLSARAAFIFAAKALPPNPLDPILYYTLKPGLGEALDRMIDQFSTVSVLTGSKVVYVARTLNGGFRLYLANGTQIVVDHLVFASSGPATLKLLEGLPVAWRQRLALNGIEFHDAALALHTDPAYVPPNPALWSFLNCAIEGDFCEASMSLGPVLASLPPATAGKLWKSWVTHRTQLPAEVLYSVAFKHMLPTPATIQAQNLLALLQGRDRIWFAGGYTRPYDSQETALRSALGVALGLHAATPRTSRLSGAAARADAI